MPGYFVVQQGPSGLHVNVHGLLDLGYLDVDGEDAQQRVTPGIGFATAYGTPAYALAFLYSFAHSRNLNADEEVTGDHYLNTNSATGLFSVPVAEDMVANVGIEYSYTPGLPDDMDSTFTVARVGVMTSNIGEWACSLGYFRAIDSRDAQGGRIGIGRKW
jgi:hypothetical protein